MGLKTNSWCELASKYGEAVYSLTKSPGKRARILSYLTREHGRILIVGSGCEPYLPRDILDRVETRTLTMSDLSRGMISSAEKTVSDERAIFLRADTRKLPLSDSSYDCVVSTNSIIPSAREDVKKMFEESLRVLRAGGLFLLYLPAFEYSLDLANTYPMQLRVDETKKAVFDTGAWQCFHTEETLLDELGTLPVSIQIEKVFLDDDVDRGEIRKIYGSHFENTLWQYFVVCTKL